MNYTINTNLNYRRLYFYPLVDKAIEIIISEALKKITSNVIDKILDKFKKQVDNNLANQQIKNDLSEATMIKFMKLSPFAKFAALPNFSISNPTMNQLLIDSFYDAAIIVTTTLDIKNENFNYYKSNYSAHHVEDKEQLVNYLNEIKNNPVQSDSSFLLGFRSIFFILNQNIDNIDIEYINHISYILKPFYDYYENKNYLYEY